LDLTNFIIRIYLQTERKLLPFTEETDMLVLHMSWMKLHAKRTATCGKLSSTLFMNVVRTYVSNFHYFLLRQSTCSFEICTSCYWMVKT